jgi:RimJ/RimL family protein N-acetyltransferase
MLETARLLYLATPAAVMRERLLRSEFDAEVPVDPGFDGARDGRLTVHFPEEWPGPDALAMFPRWVERQSAMEPAGSWGDGIAILKEGMLAAGSMGFRAAPDAAGTVELGYSVNRSLRGRGYATEMATALAAWALAQPGVRTVGAECLAGNAASIRVLEKAGFVQGGRRTVDDGVLLRWERTGGGEVAARARRAAASGGVA